MYDVAIIGAGVTGSAIARELSRYQLRTVVLERGPDVAWSSSRANSGIVHGGYDAVPGSLKAHYNVAGNKLFDALSEELDFPFNRCGSLVLAFDKDSIPALESLREQGIQNGVEGLEVIGREDILKMEPNAGTDVFAALWVPSGGIVCPYEMTIAFAENAATNGVEFKLNCLVEQISKQDSRFDIQTSTGTVQTKILINAAGLFADDINNMLSEKKIIIVPRKGEYCLLDKAEKGLVNHTLFQLPGKMGKGVLVTPTVDGNILIGPTSYEVSDKEDTATTWEGLEDIWRKAELDVNQLPKGSIITSFAGLRAHSIEDDFIIGFSPDVEGLLNVAGIESPGLSSAPAIALEVAQMVADVLQPKANKNFSPVRKVAPRFRHLNSEQQAALIKEDPNYGHIVCRCETVTKAEIIAALHSPLEIRDLDAIKRRTRAGMGRCQAGFCTMRLPEIIAAELGIPITQVTKCGPGSNLLLLRNKEEYPCGK